MNKKLGLMLGASCILLGSGAANAQATPPSEAEARGQIPEITVTAQRRSERLQTVPIAVAALTANELSTAGITNTSELVNNVPGMSITTGSASGLIFIRGVGTADGTPTNEPSVATYVDGVYIAAAVVNQFDLFGVDRMEVLKGPQGTLFGRNATGGIIQVITKDPNLNKIDAEAKFGYGNYNTITAGAYLSVPVSDTVAFNISGQFRGQGDGWGHNLARNNEKTYIHDDASVRAKLLVQPSDATRIVVAGDFDRLNTTGNDYQSTPGAAAADGVVVNLKRYDTRNGSINKTNIRSGGLSLTIQHDFDFGTFKSITSWRKVDEPHNDADLDMTPVDRQHTIGHIRQHNWTQEIHLASPDSSALKWLVGAFYFDTRSGYDPISITGIDLGGGIITLYGIDYTRSLAGFAQATYEVVPNLNVTAGFRYTEDWQKHRTETLFSGTVIAPTEIAHQTTHKPTWRLAVDYKFMPDTMGYVSYNRGIKSGGFSPLTAPSSGHDAYAPEQLDAYEVGLKTELAGRKLRLNTAAFWYDYKNIQVFITNGAASFTESGGAARIRGFDADITAIPFEGLTLTGGLAYLDGKYTNYPNATNYPPLGGAAVIVNATGNRTINTPKFSGSITADYEIPLDTGRVNLASTLTYKGKTFFNADNVTSQHSFALLSANIRWASEGDRYYVKFWGTNLTNRGYYTSANSSPFGDLLQWAPPRQYGVTVGAKF